MQVFNSIADGFGISIEELQEICIDLKDELNMTKVSITERIAVLIAFTQSPTTINFIVVQNKLKSAGREVF